VKPRRLRWGPADSPPLKHPYRDTLLVYAGLAVVIVVFAAATGGDVGKAVILAVAFFVFASAWSLMQRRRLLRREARERELGDL
jgi:Flp pilus assembly protein TadB